MSWSLRRTEVNQLKLKNLNQSNSWESDKFREKRIVKKLASALKKELQLHHMEDELRQQHEREHKKARKKAEADEEQRFLKLELTIEIFGASG